MLDLIAVLDLMNTDHAMKPAIPTMEMQMAMMVRLRFLLLSPHLLSDSGVGSGRANTTVASLQTTSPPWDVRW